MTASLSAVSPRWTGQAAIVAATGPSLTADVAEACRAAQMRGTHRIVAVNDAYRLLPSADVLFACDAAWWDVHKGCAGFAGEKWSSHGSQSRNNKASAARKWGLRLVAGAQGEGFSTDPERIHYGRNSGFQAINIAMLFGATQIVLVGFNMCVPAGQSRHFFGDHPRPLSNRGEFERFRREFDAASRNLPPGVQIINATPLSALKCFPVLPLADALAIKPGAAPETAPPAPVRDRAVVPTSAAMQADPRRFDLYREEVGTFPFEDYAVLLDAARRIGARTALEFGPGTSTLALLEAGCKRIVTYEHDPRWRAKAVTTFARHPEVHVKPYANAPRVPVPGNERFDIAFVDSPKGVGRQRVLHRGQEDCSRWNTVLAAMQHADLVLLHDAKRDGEQATLRRAEAMGWRVNVVDTRKGMARISRDGV